MHLNDYKNYGTTILYIIISNPKKHSVFQPDFGTESLKLCPVMKKNKLYISSRQNYSLMKLRVRYFTYVLLRKLPRALFSFLQPRSTRRNEPPCHFSDQKSVPLRTG
jgi:hypothetical protein